MSVVSKTAETNAPATYWVSCLAGPRLAGRRVKKGDKLELTEHQARGLLASGELVEKEDRVDDPWGEKPDAKAAEKPSGRGKADAPSQPPAAG